MMKSLCRVFVCVFLIIFTVQANAEMLQSDSNELSYQTFETDHFKIDVPSNWKEKAGDDCTYFYANILEPKNSMLMVSEIDISESNFSSSALINELYEALIEGIHDGFTIEDLKINGDSAKLFYGTDSDKNFFMAGFVYYKDGFILSPIYASNTKSHQEVIDFVKQMALSVDRDEQEVITSIDDTDSVEQPTTDITSSNSFDFSQLSLSELNEILRQVQYAMWQTDEWESVTVPNGVYTVGIDIPAGRWTITASAGQDSDVYLTKELNDSKSSYVIGSLLEYERLTDPENSSYKYNPVSSTSWELPEGYYLIVEDAPVIFTPYVAPHLDFKAYKDESASIDDTETEVEDKNSVSEEANNTSLPTDTPTPTLTPNPTDTLTPTPEPTHTPKPTPTLVPKEYPELKLGDKGDDVKNLQEALIKLGYLEGSADGVYGEKTKQAVRLFINRNNDSLHISATISINGIANSAMQNFLYNGDPVAYKDPDMVLKIPDDAYAEWNNNTRDSLQIHFQVRNKGLRKTVEAFEIYVYATDVWNKKIYGTEYYHWTTTKSVAPGETVYSDYGTIPNKSEINTVYCGIHKVLYTDGTKYTVPDDQIDYVGWDIT